MAKNYIKGMLAGAPIKIYCNRNQGLLIRCALESWLDEDVISDEKTKNIVPLTEKDIKEYLDNAIRKWRKTRDDKSMSPTSSEEMESVIASCYIDAFQSVRMSLFGELLQTEDNRNE